MARWRTRRCRTCRGYGVVAHYTSADFEGAAWCPRCDGSGTEYVSEAGRVARYPGGPLLGSGADFQACDPATEFEIAGRR